MNIRFASLTLLASFALPLAAPPADAMRQVAYPYKFGAAPHRGPIVHVGSLEPPYRDRRHPHSYPWTEIANFPGAYPDTSLLLTDGRVITHSVCTNSWGILTPDRKGRYDVGHGKWSDGPTNMPEGYYPLYYASAILPDGRMIVEGGEYNGTYGNCGNGIWTNKGALYDPVADTWTAVTPPAGWTTIGDSQSAILPNGSYMLADCCGSENLLQAIASITGTTVNWTATGGGKADSNNEEGWINMPDGTLLTLDAWNNINGPTSSTEIYTPRTGMWTAGPNTASQLVDASHEVGPAVLRPDGLLVWFGANTKTGAINILNTNTNSWSAGPSFPVINGAQYDVADGPAVLLPNGDVLVQASPGLFNAPSHFFEFRLNRKGKPEIPQTDDPLQAPNVSSFQGRFLMLPNGQALWSEDGGEMAVYTSHGKQETNWLPIIGYVPSTITIGSTGNVFNGYKLNGWSAGAAYGDDAQEATNFPLIRITNNKTGAVCFARTYNFSTMGVWNQGQTSGLFDLPVTAGCDTGASTLQMIVNGIDSYGQLVTVQ